MLGSDHGVASDARSTRMFATCSTHSSAFDAQSMCARCALHALSTLFDLMIAQCSPDALALLVIGVLDARRLAQCAVKEHDARSTLARCSGSVHDALFLCCRSLDAGSMRALCSYYDCATHGSALDACAMRASRLSDVVSMRSRKHGAAFDAF